MLVKEHEKGKNYPATKEYPFGHSVHLSDANLTVQAMQVIWQLSLSSYTHELGGGMRGANEYPGAHVMQLELLLII